MADAKGLQPARDASGGIKQAIERWGIAIIVISAACWVACGWAIVRLQGEIASAVQTGLSQRGEILDLLREQRDGQQRR